VEREGEGEAVPFSPLKKLITTSVISFGHTWTYSQVSDRSNDVPYLIRTNKLALYLAAPAIATCKAHEYTFTHLEFKVTSSHVSTLLHYGLCRLEQVLALAAASFTLSQKGLAAGESAYLALSAIDLELYFIYGARLGLFDNQMNSCQNVLFQLFKGGYLPQWQFGCP
jgi:hypothetical protein